MNSSTLSTAPAEPRCGSTVSACCMRARAVMPATSSASSGESVHRAASMLAMITSAICSTGMAGVPRTSGLGSPGPSRSRRPRRAGRSR